MPIDTTKKPVLTFYSPDFEESTGMPYMDYGVSAGFPSPAQDFMEYKIDLNRALAKNPLATFYIKVSGHSMINAGIDDGDILVADRSLEPENGKIAICLVDGEFTVKRLKIEENCIYLMPENDKYQPLQLTEDNQFTIWAIVTYVIKEVR